MFIRMYSIFDRVSQIYSEPFSAPNNAAALRAFSNAQNIPDTALFMNPADFQLHFLGVFDNATGLTEFLENSEKIADGRPRFGGDDIEKPED